MVDPSVQRMQSFKMTNQSIMTYQIKQKVPKKAHIEQEVPENTHIEQETFEEV